MRSVLNLWRCASCRKRSFAICSQAARKSEVVQARRHGFRVCACQRLLSSFFAFRNPAPAERAATRVHRHPPWHDSPPGATPARAPRSLRAKPVAPEKREDIQFPPCTLHAGLRGRAGCPGAGPNRAPHTRNTGPELPQRKEYPRLTSQLRPQCLDDVMRAVSQGVQATSSERSGCREAANTCSDHGEAGPR